ncbi:ABC transporter permease [Ornithinimicrobium avium]|uniref:Multidrug ABC transporter permease n=1 Tax=Ornithinimicrobium avium TaxID=2283195 RepID=A0A345NN52_9MICO|nr:multidrug ABC transporter permease [Ornithinimicrobium avium]AXH96460.1 multidrug ABC transporter permease [Ornithinimicrobium avium]
MSAVTGTPVLARATLHQDGRNIAPWVLLISLLSASSVLIYRWIFTSEAERTALATSLGLNPALSLIFGPAGDLTSADGFNAWRAGMLGAFFAGLMTILIVARNGRAQEDSGQAELLASAVVGRQTRLFVAVLVASLAAAALGVVCFLLTWASGGGVLASATLAATFTASGLVFAGVAAVTNQLASDARAATATAIGTLGVLYALRGYLDSSAAAAWTGWLTPFGWFARADPGGSPTWWPLLVALGCAVLLTAVAFALQQRRDFGLGMVPQRPGPADGGRGASLPGLTLALHRGSLVGWALAFVGLGLLFGTLVTSVGDLVAQNPAMAAILAAGGVSTDDLSAAFVATVLQIIGIVAAVLGVQIIMRIHAEEVDHRVEPLLAAAVRRPAYLATNLALALVATAGAMLLSGLGLGYMAHRQDAAVSPTDVVSQALVTVVAVWVLVALATAAVGAVPSRRVVGWLGVLATFGLTLLGPTFRLPGWALSISPLRHVPVVSAADPAWSGLAWLTLPLALFLVVAFVGFRRRDIL